MDDGTTGFVMALARQDSDMVRAILASLPPTPVNQVQLSTSAVLAMDRDLKGYNVKLREVLMDELEKNGISPWDKAWTSKGTCRQ